MTITTRTDMFSINHSHSLWKLILVRSKGAITVFATAPAKAPANSELVMGYCSANERCSPFKRPSTPVDKLMNFS